MYTFNRIIPKRGGREEPVEVLLSKRDFERWYLAHFDFSMFSKSDINYMLEEEKPKHYPCIPLLSGDGLSIAYVGLDLVEHWFKTLYD